MERMRSALPGSSGLRGWQSHQQQVQVQQWREPGRQRVHGPDGVFRDMKPWRIFYRDGANLLSDVRPRNRSELGVGVRVI